MLEEVEQATESTSLLSKADSAGVAGNRPFERVGPPHSLYSHPSGRIAPILARGILLFPEFEVPVDGPGEDKVCPGDEDVRDDVPVHEGFWR